MREKRRLLQGCLALPAHGDSFADVGERITQLEEHHQERLELIKAAACRGTTAYDICNQIFNGDLSRHEMRFAMAETLAHLVFLAEEGKLRLMQRDGKLIFCDPERQ